MNDGGNFERMLAALPPPDDDIAGAVSPWRRAMRRIVAGYALTTVTLHFFSLEYLLPAIGILLLLLGFRTLRRENPAMRACFLLACLRTAVFGVTAVCNACVLPAAIAAFPAWMANVHAAIVCVQIGCFWRGLAGIREKSGAGQGCPAAGWLLVWSLGILALRYLEAEVGVLGLVLLALNAAILVGLWKTARSMDEAGYAVTPAPVRLPDAMLTAALVIVTLCGMACGYLFASRYPMAWAEHTPAPYTDTAGSLIALGVPAEVLADLTPEELAAMDGAMRVVGGEEGRTAVDGLYSIDCAVQLPPVDGRDRWRILHYFVWREEPGFRGTEALHIWPTARANLSWETSGDYTGRVFCERDGIAMVSPYASFGWERYSSTIHIFGQSSSTDLFAEFSFPKGAERCRGYLLYDVLATTEPPYTSIIDSWINYIHQETWAQFPVLTAKENRITRGWLDDGAFTGAQWAIQFFPYEIADGDAALPKTRFLYS